MKKFLKIIYFALVVILVLQSMFFSVLLIQFSDSMAFRLFIGFIGIGLLIVMPVLGLAKYSLDDRSGINPLMPVLTVLVAVVMPWIPMFTAGFTERVITGSVVPVAALSLSAAIAGSAVNMFRMSVKNPDGVGTGMRTVRWIASVLVMLMALNIFFPAFARLAAALAQPMGLDASLPVALVMTDRLWEMIFISIGNIYFWMMDFVIAFIASVRFYLFLQGRDIGRKTAV